MSKSKIKNITFTTILTAYAVLSVILSGAVKEGVYESIMRCLNIIIPSLFSFMAASFLIIRSGAHAYLSVLLAPLGYIIKLPRQLLFTFFMGNAAGYPVGASSICELYDKGHIDKSSASRLICTCYGAGPAFFGGAVGLAVFSSSKVGMIIYSSVLLANITAAAVLNRIFPIKYKPRETKISFTADMLSESVYSAGTGLLKICGMILLFGTFTSIAQSFGFGEAFADENTKAIINSFIEISNLSMLSRAPYYLLPLISAAGSFGGLCVIMQIKAIVGKRFSMLPFMISRIFCAGLSAGYAYIINKFFGVKFVEAAVREQFIVNFNNFIPSLCLIMMIFLTVFKKRLDFSEEV